MPAQAVIERDGRPLVFVVKSGRAQWTYINPGRSNGVDTAQTFQVTKYDKKGQTVFKPNPGWWGPKPHVDAVAYVYYTNADSMIADLQSGQISAVDQVPFTAVNAVTESESMSLPSRSPSAV